MSYVAAEITTQPEVWARAAELAATAESAAALPAKGERVAIVGCGTSWFMAQSAAVLREQAGEGETDAFAASQFPTDRSYDLVIAITRSGTTTEVIDLLRRLGPGQRSTVLTTEAEHPVVPLATHHVLLGFADEQSVVQTRFATGVLAWWRAALGEDLTAAIKDAETELATPLADEWVAATQFSFLGDGWTVGLANEAALKLREAAQAWTESYPAMEFRHGPISIVDQRSVVWVFGDVPVGLADQVAATGATLVHSDLDPMASLTSAQRVAVALAEAAGKNPDEPRALTRSIILA
ncbi:sugar isomerase [Flexivirga oryzae]|uniref:Fructoselysine-6-P-deglycase FrlB-like protein n=1 Tax=Flexivirga oryzae TaxID=1794944 RepID=A0A839NCI8_9MICO|nr:fructoselysine-6-P-deglycase FrlB-like protein [Flexivirga oryzae]